jgi:alkanesulfonate monooxygenase SsuD/methylene tetrahydromethanopterin reductase-like flavin-dependent oxidoreductase (luciferase family)
MADYGSPLQFGLSVTPEASDIEGIAKLVRLADATGLDLVAIQDHAYNHTFLDTWTLITFLAAKTQRVHFLLDVADLPLRPPAMLAKAVATLDQLTGGRAELAVGAGAFWDAIAGMGGPRRTPAEAVAATAQALEILRHALAANGRVVSHGEHYAVRGYMPGPRPAHAMQIWVGAQKPRMLDLIGRSAGGWVCAQHLHASRRRAEVPGHHRCGSGCGWTRCVRDSAPLQYRRVGRFTSWRAGAERTGVTMGGNARVVGDRPGLRHVRVLAHGSDRKPDSIICRGDWPPRA